MSHRSTSREEMVRDFSTRGGRGGNAAWEYKVWGGIWVELFPVSFRLHF